MVSPFATRADAGTVPIEAIETAKFAAWARGQDAALTSWLESTGFKAESGSVSLVAGADGKLARVRLGVDAGDPLWSYAGLPMQLPLVDHLAQRRRVQQAA